MSGARLALNLGQAEVQDFGASPAGDKNVSRLDVAMNDALGVRGIQRVGDVNRKREERREIQRARGNLVFQSCAIQILHGDEGFAGILSNIVNRADVRMIQRGRGLGFAPKTFQGLPILGYVQGRNLRATKRSRRVSPAL